MDVFDQINLKHNILFGTEIEFCGIKAKELGEYIPDGLNLKLILDHKQQKLDFDEWYLDYDSSIKDEKGIVMSGGEISSKIMHNKKSDYQELWAICDFLKKSNVSINEYCSNHVHLSINEDYDFNYFLETLAKVMAVYETELIYFFMGEKKELRKTFFEYCRSLNPILLNKLKTLVFSQPDIFYRLLYGKTSIFTLRSGVNLQNFMKTGQIEFRYANGSLNPLIIKNNIRMCLLLIDAILDYRFDLKYLNEKIDFMTRDLYEQNRILLNEPLLTSFEELMKTVALKDEDKALLLNQYKCVS